MARSRTSLRAWATEGRISALPGIRTWCRSARRTGGTDPFGGEVRDGVLYGRGACDMKGAIAAFVAGVAQHLEQGTPNGSISLLITGDEEGPATDGTVKVLEWMRANDQIPDFCLVGEPTCPVKLGDMVKIGRRGSVNMKIEVHGTQGHVAYPHRADNPVHRLIQALDALTSAPVDAGTDWFEPSSLQVTSIDVGNGATNVIPASARAALNIRFNDGHSGASLTAWVRATMARYAERFDLESSISGESFVTKPGPLVDILRHAIRGRPGSIRNWIPAAARRMRALSRITARSPNSGWSARRCIRPTNAFRWRNCAIWRGSIGTSSRPSWHEPWRWFRGKASWWASCGSRVGGPTGLRCFGSSPQAFLSSLAPLIAFPLVGARAGGVYRGAATGADGSGHDAVRPADARGGVL